MSKKDISLPEAQMDRFLMKMSMGYPDRQEEKSISQRRKLRAKMNDAIDDNKPKEGSSNAEGSETVHVDAAILTYIVGFVHRTREDHREVTGASPRASQSLFKTARASAAIDGRDYVIPDDAFVALDVVSHRIVLKPESKIRGITGEHIVRKVISEVPVPVVQ